MNKIKIFLRQTFCRHDFEFKRMPDGKPKSLEGFCTKCNKMCLYDENGLFHSFPEYYNYEKNE